MKVRVNLKRIENLSYQFSDNQDNMLKNLNSKVQDLLNHFHSLPPQKDGLVLRPKRIRVFLLCNEESKKLG